MEHRGELIWAALTLVQAWMSAGKPPGAASLGSFEAWAQLMGGILDVARIPSFLGNQERLYEDADSEGPEWVAFCAAWWGQFQDSPVKAAALLSLAIGHGLLSAVWAGYKWHAALVRFGKALSQMRDRVFAGYRIRAERDRHTKMTVYRLEPTSQRAGAAGGASPPTTQGTTHSSTSRNIPQHPADPATVGSGPGYQWEAEVL